MLGTFEVKTNKKLVAQGTGKIEHLTIKEGDFLREGSQYATLSSKEIDKAIEDAKDGVDSAKKALKTQKKQLEEYRITAPISGKVISKKKKKGDTYDPSVDASAGAMATIYDMSALTFDMAVDEIDISKVAVGQKVSIQAVAFPDETYEGVVERISMKGDTSSGITTYPVTVKVEKYGNLLPGMNVTGTIITEEADDVLIIPSVALFRGNVVYVKKADATADSTDSSKNAATSNSTDASSSAATSNSADTTDAVGTDASVSQNESDTTSDASMLEQDGVPKGFVPVNVTVGLNDGNQVEIKSGLNEGDIIYVPYNMSGMDGIDGMGGEVVYTDDGGEY